MNDTRMFDSPPMGSSARRYEGRLKSATCVAERTMLDIKTVSDRLSNPDPDAVESLDFEVGMPLLLVDTSGCDMEEDERSSHTCLCLCLLSSLLYEVSNVLAFDSTSSISEEKQGGTFRSPGGFIVLTCFHIQNRYATRFVCILQAYFPGNLSHCRTVFGTL